MMVIKSLRLICKIVQLNICPQIDAHVIGIRACLQINLSILFKSLLNYLKLAFQFVLSLDTALVLTTDNYYSILLSIPSIPPFFLFLPWWLLETVTWYHLYSVHIVILFWLRRTSVNVETYQLSFRVLFCASFIWRSLCFFRQEFPIFILIFVIMLKV